MIGWQLICPTCGRGRPADGRARRCRPCGLALELHAAAQDARPDLSAPTLLGRYRGLLPPIRADAPLTLGEGRTPLVHSAALGPLLRLERLAFKLEAANPTGSWVDRGTVAQVQQAREAGIRRVALLADGGLALSTARYAARAGLGTTVVAASPILVGGDRFPDSAAALRSGARLIGVQAGPVAVATALRRAAAASGVAIVDAEDPVWAAGLRTLAFELVDSADGPPPDLVVIASATGVEGRALAAGFRAWHRAGLASREPAVLVVGRGAASTPDGLVVDARDAGAARRLLAEEEGIAASPASAAALAGVVRLARAGEIAPDARVVVVLADERPSGAEGLDDDPQLVGRVLGAVAPAGLARVLARPAF